MDRLLVKEIWPTIRRISQKAKRIEAAIAYLTSDANLVLGSGDLIVVNASEEAIRNGETSARLLHKLYRRGVVIYHRAPLHAKVVLMDQTAVIGSANASVSSTSLDEAAVITTNPTVVSQTRSFIYQLARCAEPLEAGRIRKLCAIKVIRRGGLGSREKRRRRVPDPGRNVWVLWVESLPPKDVLEVKSDVRAATKQIRQDYPRCDPSYIKWTPKDRFRNRAMPGDRIVVIWSRANAKNPYRVNPPSTILWRQNRRKWALYYFDPELSRPLCSLKWKDFAALCRKADIRKIAPGTDRMLSPVNALELTRLWPRSRSKRK